MEDFIVMKAGSLKPAIAAVDYGSGEEKDPGLGFILLENQDGKKRIVSGSGNPENYGIKVGDCVRVRNQSQNLFRDFKVLQFCYGTDNLPEFPKGTYPWYVMK